MDKIEFVHSDLIKMEVEAKHGKDKELEEAAERSKFKMLSYVVAMLVGMLALSVAATTGFTFSLPETTKELSAGSETITGKDGALPLHVAGLRLSTDSVAGVGVRTSLARRTGDFLGFYSGFLLSRSSYEHVARKHPAIASVTFDIAGTDWLVARESRSDVIGYVNEPPDRMDANVVAIPFHLDTGNAGGCNAVGYFAGAPIIAGQELLVHYGYDASRDYPVGRPIAQPSNVQPADAVLSLEAMRQTSRYCAPLVDRRESASETDLHLVLEDVDEVERVAIPVQDLS